MQILILTVGITIGAIGAWLYFRLQNNTSLQEVTGQIKILETKNHLLEDELKKTSSLLSSERNKLFYLNSEFVKSQARNEFLNEKLSQQKAELDELQSRFTKEFENLANRILEEKSERFAKLNKVSLDEILKPLSEKIKDFEKKIEDSTKENIERHTSLKEQIFHLNQLNQQISKEANNLASALKGQTKVQGKWGEIILERILEKSGLCRDREYFVQLTVGSSRPDIIINLPDNKKLIIDAKVSLTAYERFTNEEDEVMQTKHLKEHIQSLKSHVKTLSEKNYQSLYSIGSLDFILLFVPIEPAFNLAVINDGEFFSDAFDKNIVIVSTSTLLATLRTISSIWRQEYQTRNVMEIAKQSGEMYDKFVGFVSDIEEIGKRLHSLDDCYESAVSKLYKGKGNLVTKAENIKKLGAKTTKSLPEHLLNSTDQ